MNIIRDLTDAGMIGLMKNFENLRNEKVFVESAIPYTPKSLIDKIFNNIPPIKNKKFDTNIGVIYTVEMAFWLARCGFTNITMLIGEQDQKMQKICTNANIKYRIINVTEDTKNMPKFDVVVGNPPYNGNAQLHQRFFNLSVDTLIKNDGVVAFLQPATPYLNKKSDIGKFKHHEQMKEYIKQYETTAWLFSPNMYFSEADIGNILSVTILKKTKSNEEISTVTYDFNGEQKTFNDIALEDISIHGNKPEIVNSIRHKIEKYIKLNGSLNDIIGNKNKPFLCRLGKIRGDISGRNSSTNCTEPFFKNSFFTLVSKRKELHIYDSVDYETDEFSIGCSTREEAENVYTYCTTKFTQFALSLLKFTTNNHRGELKSIPVVDFADVWTDKKLFDLFELTQDEIDFINEFIGDFYE